MKKNRDETKITRILFTVAQLEIQQHAYLAAKGDIHTQTAPTQTYA